MSDDYYQPTVVDWLTKVLAFYPETSVEHALLSAIKWVGERESNDTVTEWSTLGIVDGDWRWAKFIDRIQSETGIDYPEII